MIAASLAFLLLVTVYPTHLSATDSLTKPEWTLDSLDCQAKSDLNKLGGGVDILRPLQQEYYSLHYSGQDFCSLLFSLRGIVEHGLQSSRDQDKLLISGIVKSSPGNNLTLFLDPTCSKCSAVFQQIESLGSRFGEPRIILVPSESEDSIAIALALQRVKTIFPQKFPDAVRDALLILSQDPSVKDEILDRYLPIKKYDEASTTNLTLQSMKSTSQHLASLGVSPPIIVYRGRLIVRTGTGVPFDPFKNINHLSAVLELIRISD